MTISNDACNGKRLSRRRFVLGTAAASAAMLPGAAFAQNALGELLQAPTRGNWDVQFDTRGSNVRQVASNSPVLSENTISSLQEAINSYSAIVQGGGWPMVPEGETLKIGVQSRTVPVLRQRLAIAGDLGSNAGGSPAFDTYVDAAVKRFQARHGLPADGVEAERVNDNAPEPVGVRDVIENALDEGIGHLVLVLPAQGHAVRQQEDGINVLVGKSRFQRIVRVRVARRVELLHELHRLGLVLPVGGREARAPGEQV